MNLFGRKKNTAQPKDATARLRETLDMLNKREKHLETKIANEMNVAKQNATKNKRVALMALKRKKQYENEMSKISGSKMTLETQMMTIENASANLEALNAMKVGSDAMKNIHGKMDINKVDATMDDIRDQMDLANEISEAISQPVGFGIDMDEDELAMELEELENEQLDEKLLGMETPSALPKAVKQPEFEDDEEKELEELRAAMAL